MLQQDEPDDYVIATGEVHSVREFVEIAFKHVGVEIVWEGEGTSEVGKDKKTGTVRVRVSEKVRSSAVLLLGLFRKEGYPFSCFF